MQSQPGVSNFEYLAKLFCDDREEFFALNLHTFLKLEYNRKYFKKNDNEQVGGHSK